MKKAVFFHGMGGGELDHGTVQYLIKNFNLEVVSPYLNYEMWVGNKHFLPLLCELSKDADCICGNSMGGYFAYHVSKMTNKPAILFNPAISEKTLSYRLFNDITEKVECNNKIVYNLSTLDSVVDHDATRDFLERNHTDGNEIIDMIGQTHSLDYNLLLTKLIKFAKTCK